MINLSSDTCTLPTQDMYDAMQKAKLGDDVYGQDPTVNRLEQLAAEIIGKEDALFVPSGTMGNLISLMTHCLKGDEVILESESHIYYYESGGISSVASLIPRLVKGKNGIITSEIINDAIRPNDIHFPNTKLICIENSHNRGGGTVYKVDQLKQIKKAADDNNLLIHMDGARLFNASIALNVDASLLSAATDSVMFCLSKGLSAPVGSILSGSKKFITKARRNRKLLGGNMRQAGILAAAGIVALEKMIDRLLEDHQNALKIGEALYDIPGIDIDPMGIVTNIVNFEISNPKVGNKQFVEDLEKRGLLVALRTPSGIRIATHRHIGQKEVGKAIDIFYKYCNTM